MIKRIAALFILFIAIDAKAQTVDDLFDENILHEVRLDIRSKDWAALKLHYLEDIYYVCNFHWQFNGRDVQVPQIGCRNRGSGSRTPIKPGLRLEIDKYDKDRRFLGLRTIVLRNNSQDASMMHERMSMAFFRRMGIPAPRSTHTRLYVNGQYAGLYTITEEVDDIYTESVYGDGTGYLFKYEFTYPGHLFEYLGPDPASYVPVPFKPENHKDDPKAGVLEAWWRTINQAPDATFIQSVSEYLDFNAFLKEVAVEQFLAEQDGVLGDYGLNNFYIYRFPNSNRFSLIPWDKSNTFFALDRHVYEKTTENILMRRALSNPAVNSQFAGNLLSSAASAGGVGGWLETEITRVYNMIRGAALEDPNKVCDFGASGNLRPCTNADFENEVAFMIQFARERGAVIRAQLGLQ